MISTPFPGSRAPFVGVLASVGDPEGTRTLTALIVLLVALGAALVMVAVWLWRSTRPDAELLAPLEVMGERRWRRGDPVWQRRRLDELRPEGAAPLDPSVAPPEIDVSFDAGPAATGFDDLHDRDPDVEPDASEQPLEQDERDEVRFDAAGASTPVAIDRPPVDDLFVGEIDAAALASAMAELDAELARHRREEPGDAAGSVAPGDPGVELDAAALAAAMAELDAEPRGADERAVDSDASVDR
jgi:hypothetical protein